jgi:signal transduction histidine kinase
MQTSSDAGVHSQYSARGRAERIIVAGRVVLAAFSLVAIWLDPSAPTKHAPVAYTLLVTYLAYALLLVPVVWRADALLARVGLMTQVVDLPVFALIMYFTEGPTSPFFVYFTFALLCGALRWEWPGTFWTAVAALAMFGAMGLYTAYGLHDPGFELNRFIVRGAYLIVVAILLGYLSAYEHRVRSDIATLAAWPRALPDKLEARVHADLRTAADLLRVPRVLMVWEEADEPWICVAASLRGEFRCTRESPDSLQPLVPEPLADAEFLCRDAGKRMPSVVHTFASGLRRRRVRPLHADLQARFGVRRVFSVPIRGEHLQGRMFFLDKSDMTLDDLTLAHIVAREVASDLDQLRMQEQLKQAAVTEERIRLARDLHDGMLQWLTGAALQLEAARRTPQDAPEAILARMSEIQDLIATEQRVLRSFIQQLKPPRTGAIRLDAELDAGLSDLPKRIAQQWGLRVTVRVEGVPEPVPASLAQEVYHIVQEAVVNAARHAGASAVEVILAAGRECIRITVADDGHGFPFVGRYDLATLTEKRMGPVSLRERIAALGGDLIVESRDTGSRIEVALPSRSPARPEAPDAVGGAVQTSPLADRTVIASHAPLPARNGG